MTSLMSGTRTIGLAGPDLPYHAASMACAYRMWGRRRAPTSVRASILAQFADNHRKVGDPALDQREPDGLCGSASGAQQLSWVRPTSNQGRAAERAGDNFGQHHAAPRAHARDLPAPVLLLPAPEHRVADAL